MEITAPVLQANKSPFYHTNTPQKHTPCKTPIPPNPPNQIHFPLHRPHHNPLKPIKLNPQPHKPHPKPQTTTSDILRLMDSLNLPIPLDIYTSLIKECTHLRDPSKALELYKHVANSGLPLDLPLLNRVLLMYVSCGSFQHARKLFDEMPVRDLNSWAVMIAGCIENGEWEEAVGLFVDMICEVGFENLGDRRVGMAVSGVVVCVLKACLCMMDLELGMQVHGWLWKMGYSRDAALCSFLISFYGKLKCLERSRRVFDQAGLRNTAVWTSRIVNCCSDDEFEEAIGVFTEMGRQGVRKNGYTLSSALKACGKIGDVGCGRQIHATTVKVGLESDGFVQCALVDLYGKCGSVKDATVVFHSGVCTKDDACWNAILSSYVQHGLCMEARKILYEMKLRGFEPKEALCDEVNLVCQSTRAEF